MRYLREERTAQTGFLLFGLAFMSYFIWVEWGGIEALFDFVWNALQSSPDFIEDIYTYFKAVPAEQLQRSLLVGAGVGALTTALFNVTIRGWLRWPTIGPMATWAGLLGGIGAYYFKVTGFWNALGIGLLVLLITSVIRDTSTRQFLHLRTLRRLAQPQALVALGLGVGIGAVAGAIGGQVLLYPLKHCSYDPALESDLQYRMGVVITAFSTLFALVPIWTLMSNRRVQQRTSETVGYFRNRIYPYLLLLPTVFFLFIFLYYPSVQILTQSTKRIRRGNPRQIEYCLQNYIDLSESTVYKNSFSTTLWMTVAIVVITMALALGIAVLASQKIRGANIYRTLLIWPYAISPVVMGVIFLNMFRQGDAGIINWALSGLFDIQPEWLTDKDLAPWLIVGAAVWNALGFNILFYVAGLQNIPPDLLEAAAIDGANRVQRFARITFPLLSPFSFFLLVANVTYSFYNVYAIIDVLTEGGPVLGPAGIDGGATNVLIYEVYQGAFEPNARVGEASAQAVILFLLVAGITLLQFRYVERRVTYGG